MRPPVGDAGSCCGGEPNSSDWWVKSISDVTGSGVVSTTVQFSSDVFQWFFRMALNVARTCMKSGVESVTVQPERCQKQLDEI